MTYVTINPDDLQHTAPSVNTENSGVALRLKNGGHIFVLNKPRVIVGRWTQPSVDIQITGDLRLSRIHAAIEQRGPHIYVVDQGSTHGTLVNDQRIAGATRLAHGDEITMGTTIFIFEDSNQTLDSRHLADVRSRIALPVQTAKPGAETSATLTIDLEAAEVRVNGEQRPLRPKERDLLRLLLSRPGRVFTVNDILAAVWPENEPLDRAADTQNIHALVKRLRQKLGDKDGAVVVTAFGIGYKIVLP